jgi:hypothetical protein
MPNRARGYDSLFIHKVKSVDHPAVIAQLVAVCIDKNIPASAVAPMFGVTRATVYNWMTGSTAPNPRYLALFPRVTARLLKRK